MKYFTKLMRRLGKALRIGTVPRQVPTGPVSTQRLEPVQGPAEQSSAIDVRPAEASAATAVALD